MGYSIPLLRYIFNRRFAGAPIAVYLLITDRCNQRCLMCTVWQGAQTVPEHELLTTVEIKRLIDEMAQAGIPLLLITGGEPLLRRDMPEILYYAAKSLPYVRLQTNATLIDEPLAEALVESEIDEIWVSLDGVGETYNVIRGKPESFAEMARGIEYLNAAKQKSSRVTPGLMFNCVVSRENGTQVIEVCRWAVEHGATELLFHRVTDVTHATIEQAQRQIGAPSIYSRQFVSSGKLVDVPLRIGGAVIRQLEAMCRRAKVRLFIDPLLRSGQSERSLCRCLFLWLDAVILPDGSVVPCQMLDRVRIGNIRKKGLVEIWNSGEMQRLRQEGKKLDLCRFCCNPRRTLFDQMCNPANFKRVFLTRRQRTLLAGKYVKGSK